MSAILPLTERSVNCRIGSLENKIKAVPVDCFVNCRIGSLETMQEFQNVVIRVNCRIGSLEIEISMDVSSGAR